MSIVKRNNLVFPALMNEIFKPDWFGGVETLQNSVPSVNIKENEVNFELALSVPGYNKEDFKVEVDKEVLTVSAELVNEEVNKDEKFTRREFAIKSFKRAFTLPNTIDADSIKANYESGILSLELPKKEEVLPKPKRLIELS